MKTYHFFVVARFRNKRENTTPRGVAMQHAIGVKLDHSQLGLIIAEFNREGLSCEDVVRRAADEMVAAFPEAILFEIHAPELDRMAVRRSMNGFIMPWRHWDQGMGEMGLMPEFSKRRAI